MNFFDWFILQQMPSRRKRPELRFYDVLRLKEKPDGTKMSWLDRFKMSYEHADYWANRGLEAVGWLARKLEPNKNTLRYLKDGVIRNELDAEEEFLEDNSETTRIREEAAQRARGTKGAEAREDDGQTTRMNGGSGTDLGGARGPRVRVYFDPDRPENRIESNQVGPERQVTHDTGAWPIKGPDVKVSPRALPAPSDEVQQSKAEETGPKKITGPEGRVALESPDAQARRESGEAAAEKGAEKARKIAADGTKDAKQTKTQRKTKAPKKSRQAAEPEL